MGKLKHKIFIPLVFLSTLWLTHSIYAGSCESDSDCKGDRICNDAGKCVNPEVSHKAHKSKTNEETNFTPYVTPSAPFCCDTYGYRRCVMNPSTPVQVGASCVCPGLGYGIGCL